MIDHTGHASGVSAITTAAPTRQKKPNRVSAHWRAISSFVVGAVVGAECMESPVGKEKARERLLRALGERQCFSWRLGDQVSIATLKLWWSIGNGDLVC